MDSDDQLQSNYDQYSVSAESAWKQPIGKDSPISHAYLYEAVDSPPILKISSMLLQQLPFCQNPRNAITMKFPSTSETQKIFLFNCNPFRSASHSECSVTQSRTRLHIAHLLECSIAQSWTVRCFVNAARLSFSFRSAVGHDQILYTFIRSAFFNRTRRSDFARFGTAVAAVAQ